MVLQKSLILTNTWRMRFSICQSIFRLDLKKRKSSLASTRILNIRWGVSSSLVISVSGFQYRVDLLLFQKAYVRDLNKMTKFLFLNLISKFAPSLPTLGEVRQSKKKHFNYVYSLGLPPGVCKLSFF